MLAFLAASFPEMNRKQIGKRLVAAKAGIDLNKLTTGKMEEHEMRRFVNDGVYKVGASEDIH